MSSGRPRLTLWIEEWLEEHEFLALLCLRLLPLAVYVIIGLVLGDRVGWLKWPLIVVLALFTLRWLIRRQEDERLRKLVDRVCLHCGYDLRASPDRCPECGEPVSPGAGPMSVQPTQLRE
jgi:hypothetical protein